MHVVTFLNEGGKEGRFDLKEGGEERACTPEMPNSQLLPSLLPDAQLHPSLSPNAQLLPSVKKDR